MSMEVYRNICQFPALSAFCPCATLSMGLVLMAGHLMVSPSVFLFIKFYYLLFIQYISHRLSCAQVSWMG